MPPIVRELTMEEFRDYSLELKNTNDDFLGVYNPKGIYCDRDSFENGRCRME